MAARSRSRRALAVAQLAFVLAAAAGCGTNIPRIHAPASSHPPATTSVPPDAQALGLVDCMRANGVPDFPDPNPEGGFDVDEFAELDMAELQRVYLQHCRQYSLGLHGS